MSARRMPGTERLLEAWLQDGPVRKRDLLISAEEAGFAIRTLERAAKKLGVVRSLLEQDHTPRNNWPVVWRLPDEDSESGQSGLSRPIDDAPFIVSVHAVLRGSSRERFDTPKAPFSEHVTLKFCASVSAFCVWSAA